MNLESVISNILWKIKLSNEFRALPRRERRDLESILNLNYMKEAFGEILEEKKDMDYEMIPKDLSDQDDCTYEVKITLNGSYPPIWRRFLVPNTVTLEEFHEIIQCSFGWMDRDFIYFKDESSTYIIREPEEYVNTTLLSLPSINKVFAHEMKLGNFLYFEKQKIEYMYDLRNRWSHTVLLEKKLDKKIKLPVCIDGKRANPLEYSGNIKHYQKYIKDPNTLHPGSDFFLNMLKNQLQTHDPQYFNKEELTEIFSTLVLQQPKDSFDKIQQNPGRDRPL
ncbi:plasmid pRiA4b ORF-3 family protein [Falsibacillus pallidus]|uniref:PRiA4b ORF-3-like protein n=1 Tax=Falsibacillus pallidus TaxID=493781 RepID=A0A370GA25_9BACI|nr:plasmid pRiA4b ORF-3 family protein [Falsibacillus pallidus]RDI40036.1 pRiA4b ORF-3-like protein [Falsibacillus pallidus]